MNINLTILRKTASILLLFALIISCSPTISLYDPYSYQETTALKVDALNLMGKASDSIQKYVNEVSVLKLRIDKIYEYEKGKPKNSITAQQWQILKDPQKNLLGGFLKEWETKIILKPAYVEDKKAQVIEAFDIIISLESKKIKDRKLK